MPRKKRFFILYWNPSLTRHLVFQTDISAVDELSARKAFEPLYNADLLEIRPSRPYSDKQIRDVQWKAERGDYEKGGSNA